MTHALLTTLPTVPEAPTRRRRRRRPEGELPALPEVENVLRRMTACAQAGDVNGARAWEIVHRALQAAAPAGTDFESPAAVMRRLSEELAQYDAEHPEQAVAAQTPTAEGAESLSPAPDPGPARRLAGAVPGLPFPDELGQETLPVPGRPHVSDMPSMRRPADDILWPLLRGDF